ncbi:2-cys peroxiredoxin, putative [Theileria equi strain WA]|uniref:2-cys peroxiredoxin, putative n=1 Tax=Theileria equi strain WA TaxID=1537102 RepID=L0AYZ0_THEEQ|nr:2-cys peroxiredoxin, putative [Theileria equi strain WA]AFZ80448.1 2-cys peroxiredoxin, putative [Theileria equi strain WA]|eukprot:XP_004830114.1 2-cys peroxiredoxin, putative [Theileria equi strain WA]
MFKRLAKFSILASGAYVKTPVFYRPAGFAVRHFGTHSEPCHISTSSLIGRVMPSFKGSALVNDDIVDFDSASYFKDSYGLLIFYPLDFTFVCPSELLGFSERIAEFEKRGIKVLGISVDSAFSHKAWKGLDAKAGGISSLKFPLVSDLSKSISKDFGLLRSEGFSHRSSVLVDKSGVVKHIALFDLGIGRSVDETLRVFDAIQFSEKTGNVCPLNWKSGDEAMKPTFESTRDYLAKKFSS